MVLKAPGIVTRRNGEGVKIEFRAIGKWIGFKISPDVFDRVEFRSIRGEVLDSKIRPGGEVAADDA